MLTRPPQPTFRKKHDCYIEGCDMTCELISVVTEFHSGWLKIKVVCSSVYNCTLIHIPHCLGMVTGQNFAYVTT